MMFRRIATVAAAARSPRSRPACRGICIETGEEITASNNAGEDLKKLEKKEQESGGDDLKLSDFEKAGKVFGYMLGNSAAKVNLEGLNPSNLADYNAGKAEFLSSFERTRKIFGSAGNFEGEKGEKEGKTDDKEKEQKEQDWNFFYLKGKNGVVASIVIATATFATFLYDWYLKVTDKTAEQLKEGAEQLKKGNKNLSELKVGVDGVQEAVVGVGKGVDQLLLLKKGEDAVEKNLKKGEDKGFWKWFGF